MTASVNDSLLTEKALDYAKLSDLAYAQWNNGFLVAGQPDYDRYKKLWNQLSAPDKGYTFVAQRTDPATGYSGVIFQDSSGKQILANRGTEFVWYNPWQTDPKDTFADGRILSGITPSEQFQSMVNFIKDKIGNSQFDVTGHSLGGCLSQTVKAAYGARVDEVYAYNALGAKNLAPDYFKI